MSWARCSWKGCRKPPESIRIKDGKRKGYCDKHLDMVLRDEENASERRFLKYTKLAENDAIERHILRYEGNGGRFLVWPIRYALENKEK